MEKFINICLVKSAKVLYNRLLYEFGGDIMLGQSARAKVVIPIGSTGEAEFTYPLNYALLYDTPQEEYAFIMGIDHAVSNFDGRIIAVLNPNNPDCGKHRIWIMAPKSSRYINIDILQKLNLERDFPDYSLTCLYESSCGAVVYREIHGGIRYLLIKNKRSSNWGFPKGHLEKGETKYDAARREVLEETGLHLKIHLGYEGISKYKIKNKVDKTVSIFVGTTDDTVTVIQKEEIEDYIWLPFQRAMKKLSFKNDKDILNEAHEFLVKNHYLKNN